MSHFLSLESKTISNTFLCHSCMTYNHVILKFFVPSSSFNIQLLNLRETELVFQSYVELVLWLLKWQNFISFEENEGVFLLKDAYKTRPSSYGTNKTNLMPLTFLTYYLRLYRTKMRPLLLNGKEHDFFFVNGRGDLFTQN